MERIKRKMVANGVIGEYKHNWEIHWLYDKKTDNESYNLYINKEYVGCYPSIVKALTDLIAQFEE